MARKTRARRCFYCERRFKNAQAVRGHQLHCPVRRLRLQAEAGRRLQPAGQLSRDQTSPVNPSETSARSVHKRHGPDSQENKLLLLDTHEAITKLHRTAGRHAWMAQWLSRAAPAHAEGHATPEEWLEIYQDLDDDERDLDQMKGSFRLDRTLLFRVYHRFLVTLDNWCQYRWRDFSRNGELTPQGQTAVHKDEVHLTDVLSKIKHMLVAAR